MNKSKSNILAAKVTYAAMRIIEKNGGEMSLSDIYITLDNTLTFEPYEKENIKSGTIRWKALLQFFSVEIAKAGYLVKKKGVWHITEEGIRAINKGEIAFFEDYHSYYKEWEKKNKIENEDDIEIVEDNSSTIENIQLQASKSIHDYIKQKNPYEFQDLVAALLRAMGYYTPFIAPKGKDGGIDIIAYQDPLGTTSPQLKVQVKHYPSSIVSVDVIRSLIGVLVKTDEVGLIVTSGTFTNESKKEARNSHRHLRLIDIDELIDLWIKYYSKMNEEDKSIMPIIPVYFIKPNIE